MIYRLALDQVECIRYFLHSNCKHNTTSLSLLVGTTVRFNIKNALFLLRHVNYCDQPECILVTIKTSYCNSKYNINSCLNILITIDIPYPFNLQHSRWKQETFCNLSEKTVWILIKCLCQKPADLDLHSIQKS